MANPLFNRVAILGLGLIGSSLARALYNNKVANHITAFDAKEDSLAYALKSGFIHSADKNAEEAVKDADLIIFATPITTFESLAKIIAPHLKVGAIVTDVASVKRLTIHAIEPYLPKKASFVPGHPIAGSENTGVEAGTADLFSGKQVILTPKESEVLSPAVTHIRTMWEAIGAKIEYMPDFLHDKIYASVSHLPQLVAFASYGVLKELPKPKDEDFVRFTRLSQSSKPLWADIAIANADYISEALSDFITFASQMEGELSENTDDAKTDMQLVPSLFANMVASCLIATSSLLQEQSGIHPMHYAGSGFADMTASANKDVETTLAAISDHSKILQPMLHKMLQTLGGYRKALDSSSRTELLNLL